MIDFKSLIYPLHILKKNVMDLEVLMNFSKTKKIILILMAIVIAAVSVGCNKKAQLEGQASPTLAAVEGQATLNPETGETPAPTATPDPLAAFRHWKIDLDKKTYNILLMGLDENEGTRWSRNDTTMILQLNIETNEMKIVSFMRDMWVTIPGYKEKFRLNNAYYRGGPDLAKQTIKSVFDVDIDYYAVVDFIAFEQIMQKVVGPIKIRVMEYEIEHLKKVESAVSIDGEQIMGQGAVQNAGLQELNAYQALSYGRDRHSSGANNERAGDLGRNERQREIVKAAWTKVKTLSPTLITSGVLLAAGLYVNTDMPPSLIISLVQRMMETDATIEDLAMPGNHWSLWIDRDNNMEYTDDDLEALYAKEKDEYDTANAPAPTDGGTGDPTSAPVAPFPDYETWQSKTGFSNVIEWSSKSLYKLHDFLGIN